MKIMLNMFSIGPVYKELAIELLKYTHGLS